MSLKDDTVETFDVNGLTVRIVYDRDPPNPRDDDNLGTMICFHRRYTLGDKHSYQEPYEFERFIEDVPHIRLPLYLYDHSGITMNTTGFSCKWDSGQVGWIYITEEKIRKEFWTGKRGETREQLLDRVRGYLENEVETYDQYLTGDVYGYIVEDEDGEDLESCWGFYGDAKYCADQGKSAAEGLKPKSVVATEANSLDGASI